MGYGERSLTEHSCALVWMFRQVKRLFLNQIFPKQTRRSGFQRRKLLTCMCTVDGRKTKYRLQFVISLSFISLPSLPEITRVSLL